LHSFIVLCEINILSLVSQNLDNFYQIQTKYYRNSDTVFFSPIVWTKRGRGPTEHTYCMKNISTTSSTGKKGEKYTDSTTASVKFKPDRMMYSTTLLSELPASIHRASSWACTHHSNSALFSYPDSPQIPFCKKKISYHIKMSANAWSTKCWWNQKLITHFCCTLRDEHFKPS
jgi:hypothetical protein